MSSYGFYSGRLEYDYPAEPVKINDTTSSRPLFGSLLFVVSANSSGEFEGWSEMANTITRSDAETDQEIRCSNGLFSVVISVLALSGSRIARTSDEKDFIIWLAEF